MLTVKKCAQCNCNNFKLLYDKNNVHIVCDACGQFYTVAVLKRLPDDIEASKQVRVSIKPDSKDLICV